MMHQETIPAMRAAAEAFRKEAAEPRYRRYAQARLLAADSLDEQCDAAEAFYAARASS